MNGAADQLATSANKDTGLIDVTLNGVRVAEITLDHAVDVTASLLRARTNCWAAQNLKKKPEKSHA